MTTNGSVSEPTHAKRGTKNDRYRLPALIYQALVAIKKECRRVHMKEAFFVFFFLPHTTKVLSGLHLF